MFALLDSVIVYSTSASMIVIGDMHMWSCIYDQICYMYTIIWQYTAFVNTACVLHCCNCTFLGNAGRSLKVAN